MSTVRASLLLSLAPAILAGGFGAGAVWYGAMPGVVLGFAVLGAMVGLAMRPTEQARAKPETPKPAPNPEPVNTVTQPILDALPLGVLVVGQDRTVLHANEEALGHFGARETEGLHVSMLRTRRLLEGIETALDRKMPSTVAFQLARTGDTYLKAHISPIGDTGDVLVAIEDETQARRSLETHRDFVANASHELKTPLAAVKGIIETLLGHARADPTATERFLHLLAGQTDRMTRLIQDLLSLNRVELNERVAPDTPEELGRVVSEVVDALRPVAEVAGVSLAFDPLGHGVIVKADREELGQLFQNLIDNAIKYGGKGTGVTITVHDDHSPGPDLIGITVRDHGPGIPRQDIPRITERFYRVNTKDAAARGGTGLGLAICQLIVNRHRGKLEITSELGDGARFTVWLPVAARVGEKTTSQPSETQAGPGEAA